MKNLLSLAAQAAAKGEVPIAACVIDAQGKVLASAHNEVEMRQDATAHAELLVMQEVCRGRGEKYLEDCTLYVTLEPCAMCAQAASLVKIKKIIFGAYDPKGGGVEHGARIFAQATCHHKPDVVGGVMEAECGRLLKDFFATKR
jgi:tRNA(adenine34) deaminase